MILRQYNRVGSRFFYHHSCSPVPGGGQTIGPESHRQHELLYLLRGDLTYSIEGRSYAVSPGDMILIAPNDIHMLRIRPGEEYERIVLHFNLELLKEPLRELAPGCGDLAWCRSFPVIPGELCWKHGLQQTLRALVENREPEACQGLVTLAKTTEVLIGLDKVFSQRGLGLATPISVDPLIQQAAAFVDAHLSDPISLDHMAQSLLVSKSSLCHRFRTAMNMTVNRYIAVKKIHLAEELIRRGAAATEAAHAVGYSNYTTFYYNYKAIIGTAPSKEKAERTG